MMNIDVELETAATDIKAEIKYFAKLFTIALVAIVILLTVVFSLGYLISPGVTTSRFAYQANLVSEKGQSSPSFANVKFTKDLTKAIAAGEIDLYGVYLQNYPDEISTGMLMASKDADPDILEKIRIVKAELHKETNEPPKYSEEAWQRIREKGLDEYFVYYIDLK